MNVVFRMDGLPTLNARLDKIAVVVTGPITREALQVGGEVIRKRAEELVHRLTGMLAGDIVVVSRIRKSTAAVGGGIDSVGEKYVLIGPGWNPDLTKHAGLDEHPYASKIGAIGAADRSAPNRDVRPADSTTNPGIYGYFLEVGHRAPGKGLQHDQQFRRDSKAAHKLGNRLNTYTTPSSREYGHLSTPPYPWLEPAFNQSKDEAVQWMADVIEARLAELGL
jgi:HK97 gp10 family phage protein